MYLDFIGYVRFQINSSLQGNSQEITKKGTELIKGANNERLNRHKEKKYKQNITKCKYRENRVETQRHGEFK